MEKATILRGCHAIKKTEKDFTIRVKMEYLQHEQTKNMDSKTSNTAFMFFQNTNIQLFMILIAKKGLLFGIHKSP